MNELLSVTFWLKIFGLLVNLKVLWHWSSKTICTYVLQPLRICQRLAARVPQLTNSWHTYPYFHHGCHNYSKIYFLILPITGKEMVQCFPTVPAASFLSGCIYNTRSIKFLLLVRFWLDHESGPRVALYSNCLSSLCIQSVSGVMYAFCNPDTEKTLVSPKPSIKYRLKLSWRIFKFAFLIGEANQSVIHVKYILTLCWTFARISFIM